MPQQGFLGDRASLVRIRKMMHDFFVQLKNNEANVRFLMLTGVTKFTKLSVFSGLNHLSDLTMDEPEYAGLLGYARPYLTDGRPIWLIGLNFDSKTRQLVDCAVEGLEA